MLFITGFLFSDKALFQFRITYFNNSRVLLGLPTSLFKRSRVMVISCVDERAIKTIGKLLAHKCASFKPSLAIKKHAKLSTLTSLLTVSMKQPKNTL